MSSFLNSVEELLKKIRLQAVVFFHSVYFARFPLNMIEFLAVKVFWFSADVIPAGFVARTCNPATGRLD